jgi:hypothetical protein
MEEITKKVTIVKTVKNGTINYNMHVDTNIDKDELVGLLTKMTQIVLDGGDPQQQEEKHNKPDYMG